MIEVNKDVIETVARGIKIPSKPELLTQLQLSIQESEPCLNKIAELISTDVGIAASVLKTVNSPFFGLSRTIVNIRQAVMYLGLIGIKNLVTGLLLLNAFEGKKCSISLERFWETATEIGNVALFIGERMRRVPVENLYTLGLFHDCGIPLLAMQFEDYTDLLEQASRSNAVSLTELEEGAYQTNHCTVGYYVASSWNLPRETCQLVLRHHDVEYLDSASDSLDEAYWAILKLAENIVHTHKNFMAVTEWPQIKEKVYACLEMDDDDYQNLTEDLEPLLRH